VRDTVNRGPLTVRLDRMQQLGYFDEYHFVLEDDDHDLSSRAYFWYGWKAAVLPLDFEAPLSLGATRRGRSAEASQVRNLLLFFLLHSLVFSVVPGMEATSFRRVPVLFPSHRQDRRRGRFG